MSEDRSAEHGDAMTEIVAVEGLQVQRLEVNPADGSAVDDPPPAAPASEPAAWPPVPPVPPATSAVPRPSGPATERQRYAPSGHVFARVPIAGAAHQRVSDPPPAVTDQDPVGTAALAQVPAAAHPPVPAAPPAPPQAPVAAQVPDQAAMTPAAPESAMPTPASTPPGHLAGLASPPTQAPVVLNQAGIPESATVAPTTGYVPATGFASPDGSTTAPRQAPDQVAYQAAYQAAAQQAAAHPPAAQQAIAHPTAAHPAAAQQATAHPAAANPVAQASPPPALSAEQALARSLWEAGVALPPTQQPTAPAAPAPAASAPAAVHPPGPLSAAEALARSLREAGIEPPAPARRPQPPAPPAPPAQRQPPGPLTAEEALARSLREAGIEPPAPALAPAPPAPAGTAPDRVLDLSLEPVQVLDLSTPAAGQAGTAQAGSADLLGLSIVETADPPDLIGYGTLPGAPASYAGSDPLGRSTILIVGVNYAPEAGGIAPHTTAMARNLAGVAERVMVFTGVPVDPSGFLPVVYRRTRRTYGQDAGVQVVRHRHHVPSRADPLGRLRYEASFSRAALRTPIRNVPQIVIGVTPSVGGAVAAARLARRYEVPLLMVVQDLAGPRDRRRGPLETALAWRQAVALRRANRVLIVSGELRGAVVAAGIEPDRIERLATWSLRAPQTLERAAARQRLGWPQGGFVVLYVGNMGAGQDLTTILRAARKLHGRQGSRPGERDGAGLRDLRFVLVGDGSQRAGLQASSADLPQVQFLDPVTSGDYPALLAAADVMVISEQPGHPDRTLASKLNSSLLAGRPVIATVNPDGETDRAVRSVGAAARSVSPGDGPGLAAALARLRAEPGEYEQMAAEARRFSESAITGTSAAQRLRDIVRTLITTRRKF